MPVFSAVELYMQLIRNTVFNEINKESACNAKHVNRRALFRTHFNSGPGRVSNSATVRSESNKFAFESKYIKCKIHFFAAARKNNEKRPIHVSLLLLLLLRIWQLFDALFIIQTNFSFPHYRAYASRFVRNTSISRRICEKGYLHEIKFLPFFQFNFINAHVRTCTRARCRPPQPETFMFVMKPLISSIGFLFKSVQF